MVEATVKDRLDALVGQPVCLYDHFTAIGGTLEKSAAGHYIARAPSNGGAWFRVEFWTQDVHRVSHSGIWLLDRECRWANILE